MAELLFQSKQEKLPDGSLIIITKILGAIDGTTVRQFEDKLIGFFNQGVKNLILIFSDVKYINSTGMGLLVKLADKFQEGGGDIKLVGVPEKVIALFDMLGLLSLFKIYETEEDAIESIGQAKPQAAAPAPAAPKAPEAPKPPAEPAKPAQTTKKPTATAAPAAPRPAPAPPAPVAPAPARPTTPAAPVPSATGNDDLGMGGGINISDDDGVAEATPPKPVSWPYDTSCGHCSGAIQYAAKGNYQCPRCHSYIVIDDFGQQVVQSAINSKLVELKCSADPTSIPGVKGLVGGLGTQVGFSSAFADEIGTALEDAIGIIVEKSTHRSETFQILAVADANEMIVGIKALNPFLVQGGPKDRRLSSIAKKVDRLEVFPLPNRGQLLKITKKKK